MNHEEKKEASHIYVNLKDHFDALWAEREKRFDLHCTTIDRRLQGLNQLREEVLKDRDAVLEFIRKKLLTPHLTSPARGEE